MWSINRWHQFEVKPLVDYCLHIPAAQIISLCCCDLSENDWMLGSVWAVGQTKTLKKKILKKIKRSRRKCLVHSSLSSDIQEIKCLKCFNLANANSGMPTHIGQRIQRGESWISSLVCKMWIPICLTSSNMNMKCLKGSFSSEGYQFEAHILPCAVFKGSIQFGKRCYILYSYGTSSAGLLFVFVFFFFYFFYVL